MNFKLLQHPLGYWEISDKPTPEELHQYYAERYFQEAKGSYEHHYSADELNYFQIKLEQRWTIVKRHCQKERGHLLDVGCGEGFVLAFFKAKDWCIKGFDFSAEGLRSKNPECKDALVVGDVFSLLENEIDNHEKYDIVWLQNILEHVLDPLDLLKSLHGLIAAKGIVVVTVPNDFSITQQAALENRHIDKDFWVVVPDHLNYFNSKSLMNVIDATQWHCLDLIADFPIDWFLFHPGSNYINDKTLGKGAHRARMQLECMIHAQSTELALNFWAAMARLGLGRDLTAFLIES